MCQRLSNVWPEQCRLRGPPALLPAILALAAPRGTEPEEKIGYRGDLSWFLHGTCLVHPRESSPSFGRARLLVSYRYHRAETTEPARAPMASSRGHDHLRGGARPLRTPRRRSRPRAPQRLESSARAAPPQVRRGRGGATPTSSRAGGRERAQRGAAVPLRGRGGQRPRLLPTPHVHPEAQR